MVNFAFLDSGTGGLPYLRYLQEYCPDASCVYIADNKNFPYGPKPHKQIVECVLEVTKKIIKKFEPAVIVVACNTISVNALDILREAYPGVLFVGTVPAIKLASSITKNKRIGLLATKATCEHPYNRDLMNHFANDCSLILREDTALIDYIEHKSFSATKEENLAAIKPAVDFFKNESCDVMILGCTHFLNLKKEFEEQCGPSLTVVDSCEGVVNRALQLGNVKVKNIGDGPQNEPRGRSLDGTKGTVLRTNQGDAPSKLDTIPRNQATLYYTGNENSEYKLICQRFDLINGGQI